MNQVVFNKKVSIERCIAQARKYYAMKGELPFLEDYLKQDAVGLAGKNRSGSAGSMRLAFSLCGRVA